MVGTSGTVVHQLMTAVGVGTCGHMWDAAASCWRWASGGYPDQETHFSNCLKRSVVLRVGLYGPCSTEGTVELRFPWHDLVLSDVVAQGTVDVAKCEVGVRVSDWEEQRCIGALILNVIVSRV